MKINCYSEAEIRDIIYNELTKREKIMSQTQFKKIIKSEVTQLLKKINGEMFNLRKEIRRLKEEIKIYFGMAFLQV